MPCLQVSQFDKRRRACLLMSDEVRVRRGGVMGRLVVSWYDSIIINKVVAFDLSGVLKNTSL